MQSDLFTTESTPQGADLGVSTEHQRFWGKTDRRDDRGARPPLAYHPLAFHNLDVAACAVALLDADRTLDDRLQGELALDGPSLRVALAGLLAFHDVGKYAGRDFQARRGERTEALFQALRGEKPVEPQPPSVGHDTLGFVLWRDVLHRTLWDADVLGLRTMVDQDGGDAWEAWEAVEPLVQAVTGHHGSPPRPDGRSTARYFDAEAQTAARAYAEEVSRALPPLIDERPGTPAGRPFAAWRGPDAYEAVGVRARRASWLLAGLAVLADWLGSNTAFFPLACPDGPGRPIPDLATYWSETAWPQAQAAVEKAGLRRSEPSAPAGLGALFPRLTGLDPTPLQAYAAAFEPDDGPHLVILEDATGAGKTEAAVLLVHRILAAGLAHGLYIGLPTRATADHMHERLGTAPDGEAPPYRRLYVADARPSLVLAHSSRDQARAFQDTLRLADPGNPNQDVPPASPTGTYDQDDPKEREEAPAPRPGAAECAAWIADGRKKALLADVGVGTVDQALLAALPVRHQSLRALGLGTAVLVVDEVHAYDEYVSGLLRSLLRMQAAMGGSAVLLSATLPRAQRAGLLGAFRSGLVDGGRLDPASPHPEPASEAFPLATRYDAAGGLAETPVEPRPGSERSVPVAFEADPEDVRHHLLAAAANDLCAAWVRNTVHDAVEAYQALRREAAAAGVNPERITLLHARFALSDRLRIETELRERFGPGSTPGQRAGRVVVATQVVEQSLDLDFDVMASDLAPVDLLVQRAGRLRRHRRSADGARLDGPGPDGREPTPLVVLAPHLAEPASVEAVRAGLTEGERKKLAREEKKGNGPGYVDGLVADAQNASAAVWLAAYEKLFPRAKYVYPHTGHLWRTQRALAELDRIAVPELAREMLRRVYDDDHPPTPDVPGPLRERTQRALNEHALARARAGQSALDVAGGYGGLKAGGLHWFSDERTPTRLGEPTVTVRLARWLPDGDAGRLLPWAGDDADDWPRSDVPARQSLVSAEDLRRPAPADEAKAQKKARDKAFEEAVANASKGMPDGGRWSVLVALREGHDGAWYGTAKRLLPDDHGKKKSKGPKSLVEKPVALTYSDLGLLTDR